MLTKRNIKYIIAMLCGLGFACIIGDLMVGFIMILFGDIIIYPVYITLQIVCRLAIFAVIYFGMMNADNELEEEKTE